MKSILVALMAVAMLVGCNDSKKSAGPGAGANGGGGNNPSGTLFDKTSSSGGSSITDPDSIIGLWESGPMQDSGLVFVLRLKFDANKVIATSQCTYDDGTVLYAQVSAPVQYPTGGVNVLQPAVKDQTLTLGGKNYTCSAELAAGFQETNIINGTLVDSDGFQLTKIGN
jgi:hypothetical protein